MKRYSRAVVGQLALTIAVLVTRTTLATPPISAASEAPPNLVVINCDDMGWGDVPGFALEGTTPPTYTTQMPNLAQLALQGARFTNFYTAQPVCSASRAALLTGCYPNRIGISGALFPDAKIGIAAQERTLGEMLHTQGYATCIAGKWHLGHLPEFNPTKHGFDEFLGIPYSNDMWPLRHGAQAIDNSFPALPLYDGATIVERVETMEAQGALTRRLTGRINDFIARASARKQPFFAYLAHPQPHAPIAAGSSFTPQTRAELYAAVMREIDWSVGEVMRTLEQHGVASNTIVMFTSDNGPWLALGSDAGSTGGLREGKGTCFEGGVRVPCIMRWPGHIPAGGVSSVPWMTIDLFASMQAIVHATAPSESCPIDGKDARAVWSCRGDAQPSHEAFYFYYHANHLEAVRMGAWKLSLPRRSRTLDGKPGGAAGLSAPYVEHETPLALFDLEHDPAETHDLAASRPEIVAAIMVHVEATRADLGDALTKRKGANRHEVGRATPIVSPGAK